MAYTTQTGTAKADVFYLNGSFIALDSQVFINPYTGQTITVDGTYYTNNTTIYDGGDTEFTKADVLNVPATGVLLLYSDTSGTILLKDIDIIYGSAYDDYIILSTGEDPTPSTARIYGGDGNDVIWGNNNNDIIYGGNGNDILIGGTGADTLYGGHGDDTFYYTADGVWGENIPLTAAGKSFYGTSADTWSGTVLLSDFGSLLPFADSVVLNGKNFSQDSFWGDTGYVDSDSYVHDVLYLTSGSDTLLWTDNLFRYAFLNPDYPRIHSIDEIFAGDGDDVIDISNNYLSSYFVSSSAVQNLTIHGEAGDDVLGGGLGVQILDGGIGNDRLFGGKDNDVLMGGAGDDLYYYNGGDGDDIIEETSGNDTIIFDDAVTSYRLEASGNDLVIYVDGGSITIRNQLSGDLSKQVEQIVVQGVTIDLIAPPPVNAGPVAGPDVFTASEDGIVTGNLLANDGDPDGDIISAVPQILTTANGGAVIINADGTFTYTPASNFYGSDSFEYTIKDIHDAQSTGLVTLNIASSNDAPVAVNDVFSGDEDTVITGNILTNDYDPEGDGISADPVTYVTSTGGVIVINADGAFTYQGALNFHGTDHYTYRVLDSNGTQSYATVTINVNSVNDAPVAVNDAYSGQAGSLITGNLLANDSDVDNDTLSLAPQTVTLPSGAQLTINADGTFSYQSLSTASGLDSFEYTLQDGQGGTSTAQAVINLTALPTTHPIANEDVYDWFENYTLTANVLNNDYSMEGLALTVTAGTFTTEKGGTVTIYNDGEFSYDPAVSYSGEDTFSYTITDTSGTSAVGTVKVTLNPVNDPPVGEQDHYVVASGGLLIGNVLANDWDPEGDPLTAYPVSAWGDTISDNGVTVFLNPDGTFYYNAPSWFSGTDTFYYAVSDGSWAGVSYSSVVITVVDPYAGVNIAPTAVNDAFVGNEDEVVTGNLIANDTDFNGDVLYAVAQTITTANGGVVTINTDGTFSYLGAKDYNGTDTFQYTVTDLVGGEAQGTVTITLAPMEEENSQPDARHDSFETFRNAVLTGSVLADNGAGADSDPDGDSLFVTPQTITTAEGGTLVLLENGLFTYTPPADYFGPDSFEYEVSDIHGGISMATANISVVLNPEETVIGTDGNDVIIGTPQQDEIYAFGGDDVVYGRADSDKIYGGDGNDQLYGEEGDDFIDGGLGDDSIFGGDGNDTLVGGGGTDYLAGGAGDDIYWYTSQDSGWQEISDESGYDVLYIKVDFPTVTLLGGSIEEIHGGESDDVITLLQTSDYVGVSYYGHGGNDTLVGGDKSDLLDGGDDNDTLTGHGGSDTLLGGAGDDVLYGDDGLYLTPTYTSGSGAPVSKQFTDTLSSPLLPGKFSLKDSAALGVSEGVLNASSNATATITLHESTAGNNSSLGFYAIAGDGSIVSASLLFANTKDHDGGESYTFDLPTGSAGGDFGFFIISNGDTKNASYDGLDITDPGNIHFVYNYGKADARDAKITDPGSKITVVYDDGVTVQVLKGDVFFTTERGESVSLNKDGKAHVVSGLVDTNNLSFDAKNINFSGKPTSFTLNGITVAAAAGYLAGGGDKVGVAYAKSGGNIIAGDEALNVSFEHGAAKVTISLADIAGNGTGIDFKIYMNGDTEHPIAYEYAIGAVSSSKIQITLDASDFGDGLLTGFEISSVSNSGLGTETFWLNTIDAEVPGGVDNTAVTIAFEDTYGLGSADYQDVVFDLSVQQPSSSSSGGGSESGLETGVLLPDASQAGDILDGGAGNDTLYGELGDDILRFGAGADHLYGGDGADRFAMTDVDENVDTIHDFIAAQGDKIDLSAVLESYDPLTDDIASFIHLVQSGSDTQIQVNTSGAGGEFVTAAIVLGGLGDNDLSHLIANGVIKVDTSSAT